MWAETVLNGIEIPLPPEPPEDDPPRRRARRTTMAGPRGVPSHDARDAEPAGGAVIDGARFVLDQPPDVAAVWGQAARVLWAPGEALMIAGPQGLGKTTLAGLLVRALLGVQPDVLGLPVAPAAGPVLYLAMDRPRQIARSLRRQFTESDRELLAERLIVRPGPPAADLAAHPTLLAAMAEETGAAVVCVDSLKDAAIGLTDDVVAASYNRARQHLLAGGCQVCELHHTVKRNSRGDSPANVVDAIYGSTWLTSGCGSVLLLSGEPGDPIVGLRHVKQPAEEVGPLRLLHDQAAGTLSVESEVDLPALAAATAAEGLTARAAAQAITETPRPSRAEIEKARRKLDALAAAGVLARIDGAQVPGQPRPSTAYFPAVEGIHGGSRFQEKPQVSGYHGNLSAEGIHDSHAPVTPNDEIPGQDIHGSRHGYHGAARHGSPRPLKGAGDGCLSDLDDDTPTPRAPTPNTEGLPVTNDAPLCETHPFADSIGPAEADQ